MTDNLNFYYDSTDPKFLGTKVGCSKISIEKLKIVSKGNKDSNTIKGSFSTTFKIKTHDYVEKTVKEKMDRITQNDPFDIEIFAYNPIENAGYVCTVLGAVVVKVIDTDVVNNHNEKVVSLSCEIIAKTITNWRRINKVRKYRLDVSVEYHYDYNPSKDDIERLLNLSNNSDNKFFRIDHMEEISLSLENQMKENFDD